MLDLEDPENDRGEFLDFIESELQHDDRLRAQSGVGPWPIAAGIAAVGWILLTQFDDSVPSVAHIAGYMTAFSLSLDLASRVVSYQLKARDDEPERYMLMRYFSGERPGHMAATLRRLVLAILAVAAHSVIGWALSIVTAAYFVIQAMMGVLVLWVIGSDFAFPTADYGYFRGVEKGLRLAGLIPIALMGATLFRLIPTALAQGELTAIQIGALGSALVFLVVLLAKEFDINVAARSLIEIRREVVLEGLGLEEAKLRTRESLIGVTPQSLGLPTGIEFLRLVETTTASAIAFRNQMQGLPTYDTINEAIVAINHQVGRINAAASTPFKQFVLTFSVAKEQSMWGYIKMAMLISDEIKKMNAAIVELNDAASRRRAEISQ